MSIYKECDIRGVYGSELNRDTAYHLGRAVGTRTKGKRIVVGGDLRISTPELKDALIQGLQASGAHIEDVGLLPTPAFYHAIHLLAADGGIMVTASHNPPRYNGFKLILGDLPITPAELRELATAMERQMYSSGEGRYRRIDTLPEYMRSLSQAFTDLAPHDLVVDCGNGSMSQVAPQLLARVGQRVKALYCDPDGTFPNRDPNPSVPAHLEALQRRMLDTRAELGVAYDGDGDRAVFVDGLGRVQPADRVLVLFIRHLLPRHPGSAVVYDLKCSSVVPEETLAHGGVPAMERSGHAFIKTRLLETGAVLGGEVSGHYFFSALGGDDALYATLLLLRTLDQLGLSFAEAMNTVPAYPITPDIRLPCEPDTAQRVLAELASAFWEHPISHLDGVRIQFKEGWALARLSVTEPMITLRCEARTRGALERIEKRIRQGSPALDGLLALIEQ